MIHFLLHRREAAQFWRRISTRAVNEVLYLCAREAMDDLQRTVCDRMNKYAMPRGLLVVPSNETKSGWAVEPL